MHKAIILTYFHLQWPFTMALTRMFVAMSSESVDIPAEIQESRIVTLQEKISSQKVSTEKITELFLKATLITVEYSKTKEERVLACLAVRFFLFTTCLLDTDIPT